MLNILILFVGLLQFIKIYHNLAGNLVNPKIVKNVYIINVITFIGLAVIHANIFLTYPVLTLLSVFVVLDLATSVINGMALIDFNRSLNKIPTKKKKIGFE
jgi:hypothetical protein